MTQLATQEEMSAVLGVKGPTRPMAVEELAAIKKSREESERRERERWTKEADELRKRYGEENVRQLGDFMAWRWHDCEGEPAGVTIEDYWHGSQVLIRPKDLPLLIEALQDLARSDGREEAAV